MALIYSCIIDENEIVNESGEKDAVRRWNRIVEVLLPKITPNSRKSFYDEDQDQAYVAEHPPEASFFRLGR